MILSDIWAEAGRLLQDPNNTRWATSVLTTRANFAQTEIQGNTNAIKTPETLTPVAGTRTISVNANTMDIVRMSKTLIDGSIRPFQGMTREELDFVYPDWQQWTDGEPIVWFFDGTNQQINLVPKPSAANAITNGLTCWESRKPADMSLSTDIPFDSNNQMIPYHLAIVHWVVAQCWMDDATSESLTKAKFHKSGSMLHPGEYEKHIGRILSEFDAPEVIPSHILYQPQGGRIGTSSFPTKANPIPW